MTTPKLIDDLKRDEGCVLRAYQDTVGVWTIGYGHAYVQPGTTWTQAQADDALRRDVQRTVEALDRNLSWWRTLNDVRQDALVNMAFNLGIKGLLGFRNTLADIRAGDFEKAASNMLQSRWARQIGRRANRISELIRKGER